MKILEVLFGWTGYNTLSFFLIGINVLLNVTFGLVIQYYPLRRYLRVKPLTAVLLNITLIFICIAIYLSFPWLLSGIAISQLSGLTFYFLLFMPTAVCLLADCTPQNLFAVVYMLCLSLLVLGIGNWFEIWFGDLILPGVSAVVAILSRILLFPIFIPLAIRSLTGLFTAWDGNSAAPFWRFVWAIPLALFVLTLFSGNVGTLTAENSIRFLLTRILSAAALQACISMMISIMNREKEITAAIEQARLLDLESKSLDASRIETLDAWDKTNIARKKARAVVENVLAHVSAGEHLQAENLLHEYIVDLDAAATYKVCENTTVNALASHYAAIAAKQSIGISFKLHVPKSTGRVQNLDLSRIVGNMLENAIEACCRMEYGDRRIRLQSLIQGSTLVLVMDNTYSGDFKQKADGQYLSSKRPEGTGTGLSSIQAIAEKYGGTALFQTDGMVFQTSVRMDMEIE